MVDTPQVSKEVIELELLSAAENAAKNLQLLAPQINESRELRMLLQTPWLTPVCFGYLFQDHLVDMRLTIS